jgi:hypothetical protein
MQHLCAKLLLLFKTNQVPFHFSAVKPHTKSPVKLLHFHVCINAYVLGCTHAAVVCVGGCAICTFCPCKCSFSRVLDC